MQNWPVQDAKARFSDFLNSCVTQGPQIVTRRGVEEAVLVPIKLWQRLQAEQQQASLKQLLLSDNARADITIPPRGKAKRRSITEQL